VSPTPAPEVSKNSKENKPKLKEAYQDELKVSPWRWGTVVGILLITALGLKMYQRYQSEIYQPQLASTEERTEVQQLDPLLEQVVEASAIEVPAQPRSEVVAESTTPSTEVNVASVEPPPVVQPAEVKEVYQTKSL
jgi:hypothetical protein